MLPVALSYAPFKACIWRLMQELAWASYTLLRNTGACSMIIYSPGQVWLARGIFANVPGAPHEAQQHLSQVGLSECHVAVAVDTMLAASSEMPFS